MTSMGRLAAALAVVSSLFPAEAAADLVDRWVELGPRFQG